MILDKLSNAPIYYPLGSAFEKSLKYLLSTDLMALPDGKHDLGDKITIVITPYHTKNPDEGILEAHRKNIDIQFMIRGSEKIGFAFLSNDTRNTASTEYDEKRDIQFFGKSCEYFLLSEGMFAIFFPDDLHMPGLFYGESALVRKAVIKIPVI